MLQFGCHRNLLFKKKFSKYKWSKLWKIGNISDILTVSVTVWMSQKLAIFFLNLKMCNLEKKFIVHFSDILQLTENKRMSQRLPIIDATRSNPPTQKNSEYLWLQYCHTTVLKSLFFTIFWKDSKYQWLQNWLDCYCSSSILWHK